MTESKELTVLTALNPLVVFGDGGVDDILAKITKEVRSQSTDISTVRGRMDVASLAYKVARSKTALDDMGKELVAEWKSKASRVDAERRRIREALDALRDEVRQPLTEWEQRDAKRIAAHEAVLATIVAAGKFDEAEPSPATIKARLVALRDMPKREWEEFAKRSTEATATATYDLEQLLIRTEAREAERAELERLRRERAELEQRQRDEHLRQEAAEKARLEAEEKAAQAARAEAEKSERLRAKIEQEKRAAEERARKAEAERIAAEEWAQQVQREAQKAAQQAEANRVAAAAEAERILQAAAEHAKAAHIAAEEQAERERVAALQAYRDHLAREKAAEEQAVAERKANELHRTQLLTEAIDALMTVAQPGGRKLSRPQATAVINAIDAGQIPHLHITY